MTVSEIRRADWVSILMEPSCQINLRGSFGSQRVALDGDIGE
jgi:hypothetical protein